MNFVTVEQLYRRRLLIVLVSIGYYIAFVWQKFILGLLSLQEENTQLCLLDFLSFCPDEELFLYAEYLVR